MRIAVVGLGVAGSYLMRRLSQQHEVVGFERQPREAFKAICAWGTSRHEMRKIFERVDFDFDEYLLHEGRSLILDNGRQTSSVPLKGLCTYEKARLQLDLTKGLKAFYGSVPDLGTLVRDFDLVVDATGVTRALLPRPVSDHIVPCFEYKVRYDGAMPFDDFYIRIFRNCSGYLWYFPLRGGDVFVGAGDTSNNHVKGVNSFLESKGGRAVERYGRAIRIAPPEYMKPFRVGKVVGVGESIGTVFPFVGEGILPSLECAEMLVECLDDLDEYERRVTEYFKPYTDIYRMVRLKQDGELSLVKHFPLIMKAYRYMKDREEYFGLEIRRSDLYLILNA
jgi:flavin-dependent dehydrogenase